ncbi:MAG: MBL fold metallo-hydrolase, partial [Rhodospirillaceae bacterium]
MTVITVGDAEIRRVEEMRISSPMAAITQDEAFVAANRHWLVPRFLGPDGHWDFIFQSWILFVDGKVCVIDPCNGNGRPHMYPMFNMLETPYIERFAASGVKPEDVDYVFCTHLHHDHSGWNTVLRDGRFVPTFPNARYMFV